jgi:hypothetical protein
MCLSSSAFEVTLVTHRGLPEGAPDDVLLANMLREAGLKVSTTPWNAPAHDW